MPFCQEMLSTQPARSIMFSPRCVLVLIFSASTFIYASEVPLGVHPANIAFYDPVKPFTCLDKSATIPWNKVNDDYCDCIDGSDEPGTSACPDMQFYCANEGFEGVFIHSSFVNDMVCDCCDGSDEYLGYVKCSNTCGTLAKEKEEQLQKRRKEIESGHQIYQEYVARKAVELEEEEKRKAAEAEKQALEAEKQASNESAESQLDNEIFQTLEKNNDDGEGAAEEVAFEGNADENNQDREAEQHEEESERNDDSKTPESLEEDASVPNEEDYPADKVAESEEPIPAPSPPKPIDYGPDNGFMMLTEPSTGCLELEDKEYVYSLCAFKEVRQRSRHSSAGGTLLGSWKEWVGHPEDSVGWTKEEKLARLPYNEMLYDDGEHCWNGPNRSVRVKVMCGAENRLVSAEEPSRCLYQMQMETPAACHHDPVKLMEMHTEL